MVVNLPWVLPDDFGHRLVILGAGGLGKKIARSLSQMGMPPLAFCDNNSALWGKEVEGLKVFAPASAAKAFPGAVFMVAIWHPTRTEGVRHHIAELQKAGCEEVTCFIPLFWRYPELFLPNMFWDVPGHLAGQTEKINAARKLLDQTGREEFDRQLRLHRLGDVFSLRDPEPGLQYFPENLITLSADETFVDCGAYDGDTIRDFLEASGGHFRRILALEPDRENLAKLQNAHHDERVSVLPYAVGARNETVRMSSSGASSSISESGAIDIQCRVLDDLLADEQPTFIKMDIEGSEVDALLGSKETIRRSRPKLAVCVYHKPDHLWSIPLLLKELLPDSRLSLRSHMLDGFDTVCYCLPRS